MSEVTNFINTQYTWIKSKAMEFTRDPVDADDLTQDVIYKMWKFRSQYSEGSNIQHWAYRIIRNSYIDLYNKRKSKRMESITYEDDGEEIQPIYISGHSEDNAANQSFFMERLNIHIDSLKPNEKDLFKFYLMGLQYEELSEIFDISIGTVKSRIHFIKKGLSLKIRKEENGSVYSHS